VIGLLSVCARTARTVVAVRSSMVALLLYFTRSALDLRSHARVDCDCTATIQSVLPGGVKNDGDENDGPSKCPGMKLTDIKMQDTFQVVVYIGLYLVDFGLSLLTCS